MSRSSHHDRLMESVSLQLREEDTRPTKMVIRSSEETFLEQMNNLKISSSKSLPPVEDESGPESKLPVCPLCQLKTPALSRQHINAVTACEHIFCFECALRLIFIIKPNEKNGHEDKCGIDCPICRQHTKIVVLTRAPLTDPDQIKKFVQRWFKVPFSRVGLPLTAKSYTSDCWYDEAEDIFEHVRDLMNVVCGICDFSYQHHRGVFKRTKSSFIDLSNHFKSHVKDPRYFCELCYDNLEFLPTEMMIYDKNQFKDHLRFGSKIADEAFVQHQRCTLCFGNVDRKAINTTVLPEHYFFDSEALAVHARKHHYSCYLCTDDRCTFYRTNDALNDHLNEEHIVCPLCKGKNAQDLADLFLAFTSIAELRRHVSVEHAAEEYAAATEAASLASASDTTNNKNFKKSSKKRMLPLTSASLINFQELERKEIEKKRMSTSVTGKYHQVQSIASVRNRLDDALRERYTAEQQANPPSFGKPDASSEKYVVHFPTIQPGAKPQTSSPKFDISSAVYSAQRIDFSEIQGNNPSFPALPVAAAKPDERSAPASRQISVNSSWQKNEFLEHRRPIITATVNTATVNTATAPLGLSLAVPSTRDVIKQKKQAWSAAVITGPLVSGAPSAVPTLAGGSVKLQPKKPTLSTFQNEEEFPSLGGPSRPGPSSGGDRALPFKPLTKQQQQEKKASKKQFFDRFKKL